MWYIVQHKQDSQSPAVAQLVSAMYSDDWRFLDGRISAYGNYEVLRKLDTNEVEQLLLEKFWYSDKVGI